MSTPSAKDELRVCILRCSELEHTTATLTQHLSGINTKLKVLLVKLIELLREIDSNTNAMREELHMLGLMLGALCEVCKYYRSPAASGRWGAVEGLHPPVLNQVLQPSNIAKHLERLSFDIAWDEWHIIGRSIRKGDQERVRLSLTEIWDSIKAVRQTVETFSPKSEFRKAFGLAHATTVTQAPVPVQAAPADVRASPEADPPQQSPCALRGARLRAAVMTLAQTDPLSLPMPALVGTTPDPETVKSRAQAETGPTRTLQAKTTEGSEKSWPRGKIAESARTAAVSALANMDQKGSPVAKNTQHIDMGVIDEFRTLAQQRRDATRGEAQAARHDEDLRALKDFVSNLKFGTPITNEVLSLMIKDRIQTQRDAIKMPTFQDEARAEEVRRAVGDAEKFVSGYRAEMNSESGCVETSRECHELPASPVPVAFFARANDFQAAPIVQRPQEVSNAAAPPLAEDHRKSGKVFVGFDFANPDVGGHVLGHYFSDAFSCSYSPAPAGIAPTSLSPTTETETELESREESRHGDGFMGFPQLMEGGLAEDNKADRTERQIGIDMSSENRQRAPQVMCGNEPVELRAIHPSCPAETCLDRKPKSACDNKAEVIETPSLHAGIPPSSPAPLLTPILGHVFLRTHDYLGPITYQSAQPGEQHLPGHTQSPNISQTPEERPASSTGHQGPILPQTESHSVLATGPSRYPISTATKTTNAASEHSKISLEKAPESEQYIYHPEHYHPMSRSMSAEEREKRAKQRVRQQRQMDLAHKNLMEVARSLEGLGPAPAVEPHLTAYTAVDKDKQAEKQAASQHPENSGSYGEIECVCHKLPVPGEYMGPCSACLGSAELKLSHETRARSWGQSDSAQQVQHTSPATAAAGRPSDGASMAEPSCKDQEDQQESSELEEVEVPSGNEFAGDVSESDWTPVPDPNEKGQGEQSASFEGPGPDTLFTTSTGVDLFVDGGVIDNSGTPILEAADEVEDWSDLSDIVSELGLSQYSRLEDDGDLPPPDAPTEDIVSRHGGQ